MKLIPVAAAVAEEMSRAIWKLQKPNPSPQEVTTRFCSWKVSELNKDLAFLMFPDEFEIPIAFNTKLDLLESILSPFIELQNLTREELDEVKDTVSKSSGKTMQVEQLVPDSWKVYVLTQEQAIKLGHIVVEEPFVK